MPGKMGKTGGMAAVAMATPFKESPPKCAGKMLGLPTLNIAKLDITLNSTDKTGNGGKTETGGKQWGTETGEERDRYFMVFSAAGMEKSRGGATIIRNGPKSPSICASMPPGGERERERERHTHTLGR